jgi:type I restriction enzyme S subunit
MPSDWKKKRLKDLATYNDNSLNNNVSGNTIINYIDIGSVTTASINCYEELLYRNAPSRAKRIIRTGDILVSTVRTYLKAISFVSKEYNGFVASTGFAVIRPKILFDNKFAAYSLISNVFINEVQANSVGVSYPAINASKLITFPVILPSLNTQKNNQF